MVLKQCPKCHKQTPVACKSCKSCGHSYARNRWSIQTTTTTTTTTMAAAATTTTTTAAELGASEPSLDHDDDTQSGVADAVKRRRTERIIRARALANDRLIAAEAARLQARRRSRRVTSSSFGRTSIDDVSAPKRRRRGRRKSSNVQNRSELGRNNRRGQLQPRRSMDEVMADEEDEERIELEPEPDVTIEESLRYTIVLDEINRKIGNNCPHFN